MLVAGLFNGGRSEGASGWVVQGMEVCGYTCPHKNVGSFLYTTLLRGCPRQRCGVHRMLCTLHTLYTGLVQQQQSVMLQANLSL